MKQINLTNESLGHNIAVEEENAADRLWSQSHASLLQNAPTDTKGPLWRRAGCGDTEDETHQLWECWEAVFVELPPLKHVVWVWVIRDRELGAEIFSHFIIDRLWRWSHLASLWIGLWVCFAFWLVAHPLLCPGPGQTASSGWFPLRLWITFDLYINKYVFIEWLMLLFI